MGSIMKILIQSILIIVFIELAIPLYAQKWEPFNSGLDINEINCMTTNNEKVFIGTHSNGVISSNVILDGWKKINNGIDTHSPGIHSIALGKNNIFAGNSLGLYISKDDGISWDIVNDGILTPGYTPISSIISFSDNLIYGDAGSIFLSENNALNWSVVGSGGNYRDISSFASNGKDLYAGTSYGLLMSSSDGGKSWGKINEFPNQILSLAAKANVLIVSTSKGVYLSNNLLDWSIENDGLSNLFVKSIAITSKYIFAATTKGIFIAEKSSIIKWKPFNDGLLNLAVGYLAHTGNILFAATYSGEVYKLDLTLLSVDAEEDNKISIFPNPANSLVTIELTNEYRGEIKIELTDILGNSIMEIIDNKSTTDYIKQIDVKNLQKGLINIKVNYGNHTIKTLNFIKID